MVWAVRRFMLPAAVWCLAGGAAARAADVYVRFRVVEPAGETFRVTTGGRRHAITPNDDGPAGKWGLPRESRDVGGGRWSDWLDLTGWPLHGRQDRAGGVAEWPAMTLTAARLTEKGRPSREAVAGCVFEVQLADKPGDDGVVIAFTEKSGSATIGFLLPHPLREKKDEFETGSQMAARHLAWAKQAAGAKPAQLKRFTLCTGLWGSPYDDGLALTWIEALKTLGFNTVGGVSPAIRQSGLRTDAHAQHYLADPGQAEARWRKWLDQARKKWPEREEERGSARLSLFTISDEIRTVYFKNVEPAKRDGWFQEYLRSRGVRDADLPRPIAQTAFPADLLGRETKALPRHATDAVCTEPAVRVLRGDAPAAAPAPGAAPVLVDVRVRRLFYHAAKFAQWWSARQLRQSTDLVHGTYPEARTETLPTSHGFFNAPGPPAMGMSHCLLDLFEVGAQESVDILAAEDWLGLNHMYGGRYTWTGAQSLEYLGAIMRSAMKDRRMTLMALPTPSDDGYLRLKCFSMLGQGAKVFYFWTFGPTFLGTENYWSDLRSEYDGVARFARTLEAGEDVLHPATTVSDPVAVLYSVSHDLWHSDDPAGFVETRLLWHALRHLSVQPDFLREEDVEAGRLDRYKALYICGRCVSRRASERIDRWVRNGGSLYLAGGAATRDEYFEPYVPPYAAPLWPADAAARLVTERHDCNERSDLPTMAPLTHARAGSLFKAALPVLACRLNLRDDLPPDRRLALYDDGKVAGAAVPHGRGQVVGLGFLPMLAYAQMAGFKFSTLEEKWPAEPRELVRLALEFARIRPVARADVPVVETSLLTGPQGSALVLVNYTYQPIRSLKVTVTLDPLPTRAVSTEGREVVLTPGAEPGSVCVQLPLEWTDVVLLTK